MSVDWEARLAVTWTAIDERSEEEFLASIERLAAELPAESAIGTFERAASLDSTGHPDRAVPLYRQALEVGLTGERRRRAVIQLASSLGTSVGRRRVLHCYRPRWPPEATPWTTPYGPSWLWLLSMSAGNGRQYHSRWSRWRHICRATDAHLPITRMTS